MWIVTPKEIEDVKAKLVYVLIDAGIDVESSNITNILLCLDTVQHNLEDYIELKKVLLQFGLMLDVAKQDYLDGQLNG